MISIKKRLCSHFTTYITVDITNQVYSAFVLAAEVMSKLSWDVTTT